MFTSVTGDSYPPVYHDKEWRGVSRDLCISSLSVVGEMTEWEESLFTQVPKSAVGNKDMRPCLVSLSNRRFGCQKKIISLTAQDCVTFRRVLVVVFFVKVICTSLARQSCTWIMPPECVSVLCVSAPSIMHCNVDACQLL